VYACYTSCGGFLSSLSLSIYIYIYSFKENFFFFFFFFLILEGWDTKLSYL